MRITHNSNSSLINSAQIIILSSESSSSSDGYFVPLSSLSGLLDDIPLYYEDEDDYEYIKWKKWFYKANPDPIIIRYKNNIFSRIKFVELLDSNKRYIRSYYSRLSISQFFRGLDDELHRLSGGERATIGVYSFCAAKFGWTKRETDEHSATFLKKIIAYTSEHMKDAIQFK